ncbi:unnamed protein product, partial [Closterium sp. Naga37s-1]
MDRKKAVSRCKPKASKVVRRERQSHALIGCQPAVQFKAARAQIRGVLQSVTPLVLSTFPPVVPSTLPPTHNISSPPLLPSPPLPSPSPPSTQPPISSPPFPAFLPPGFPLPPRIPLPRSIHLPARLSKAPGASRFFPSRPDKHSPSACAQSAKCSSPNLTGDLCHSFKRHFLFPSPCPPSPQYTQWTPRVSPCLVAGLPIEELDAHLNFRRGWTLGFTEDVEDKTQILPLMRGAMDPTMHARERRVFLDLGAKEFNTSVTWFLQMYPLDFTEIHAVEARPDVFQTPSPTTPKVLANGLGLNSRLRPRRGGPADFPKWLLQRVHPYNFYVSSKDNQER